MIWKPEPITHDRARLALTVLRVALAGLLAAHGWMRFLSGGYVPFGGWLESQGVPFGPAVAIAVTAIEVLGTPLLAWGRLTLPLCLVYSAIYATGIVMVHAPEDWFVVGAGRNGMEYSVLLIVCLLAVGLQHWPARKP